MQVYSVQLSEPAEEDVCDIVLYISKTLFSPSAAIKMADAFDDAWFKLAKDPHLYALVRDKELAARGVRSIYVKNYSAFFVINELTHVVDVIRVLHHRQNWVSIL
ncbi:hypothetical protein FACS1894184_05640 [Clostridia bacterium]|nr:hypothetical protein FACS1894184_05640 [Clostridia bacterium]